MKKSRIIVLMWLSALVFTAGAPAVPDQARGQECGCDNPEALYARARDAAKSLQTYTSTYYHESTRNRLYFKVRISGRYQQKPPRYCEERLWLESNFESQAGAGFQECYNGVEDINRLLMPGALRALGIIPMMPEDPKSGGINGDNSASGGVWDWYGNWDKLIDAGDLSCRCVKDNGAFLPELNIRVLNPVPPHRQERVVIRLDPATLMPVLVETYVSGRRDPAMVSRIENFNLNPPLTDDDLWFQGTAPRWNLIEPDGGPHLSGMKKPAPPAGEPADPAAILDQLASAAAALTDFSADLTIRLRYKRLRQYRRENYLGLSDGSFRSETIEIESNYVLMNAGEGFRAVFDAAGDRQLHIRPAGVYRVMGEQVFPTDDPRLFTPLHDDLAELSLFALAREMRERAKSGKLRGGTGPDGRVWIEAAGRHNPDPRSPTVMRLWLDRESGLPVKAEFTGYDDPKAFLQVDIEIEKLNGGFSHEDLWD